jgi:hypothetical protein
VSFNPVRHQLACFNVRALHVNGADLKLFFAQMRFVVRRHVMFDEEAVASNLANKVGLVPTCVEITVSDLTIIVGLPKILHHSWFIIVVFV